MTSRRVLARKTATTLEAHHAVKIIKQALEKFDVPELLDLRCGGHSGVEENQKTFIGDSLSHFATNDKPTLMTQEPRADAITL